MCRQSVEGSSVATNSPPDLIGVRKPRRRWERCRSLVGPAERSTEFTRLALQLAGRIYQVAISVNTVIEHNREVSWGDPKYELAISNLESWNRAAVTRSRVAFSIAQQGFGSGKDQMLIPQQQDQNVIIA